VQHITENTGVIAWFRWNWSTLYWVWNSAL